MTDELQIAFRNMFGVLHAHRFQIEVAEHLLNGESVILQAPTGSGKTWTALFPFLHAWRSDLPFPRKCLYAVPLRVLATQFQEDATGIVETWGETDGPAISLQTGEQQGDRTFEGDLIFTTIDQVLSSALSVPYSLGHRRANVNAGAVLSSFLVCDEIHLFPVDERTGRGSLATLLTLLEEFGHALPFLLMTATLSGAMLSALSDRLGASLVSVSKDELAKIGSQQKVRRYFPVAAPLSADGVLAAHKSRSVVICNQVQRAVDLFDALVAEVEADPVHSSRTEVVLLHSRFVKQHRKAKETIIRKQFGRQLVLAQRQPSVITVATQAIEVGLDITCEHLHTELAPANAIIQRAGRCARYQGEHGNVYIYHLTDDVVQPHLPYDAQLCAATWDAFSSEKYAGQALGFQEEQAIVTTVHDPSDARLLMMIQNDEAQRWRDMSAAMFRGDTEGRTRLIRQIDTRTVLVHPKPTEIRDPYALPGFSLYHGTLRGWINKVKHSSLDWVIRYPVANELADPRAESRGEPAYDWRRQSILDEQLVNLSAIFVVNPELVDYDAERGLRLRVEPRTEAMDLSALIIETRSATGKPQFETHYCLESYVQHIDALLRFYEKSGLRTQMKLAGARLVASREYDFSAEQFELAVRLALALHDVGKLQTKWQTWSHAYQRAIGEPADPNMMIVHTHYWPAHVPAHIEAETKLKQMSRPHHAAEGAFAVWPVLRHALGGNDMLMRAVFTAIARHHAPWVDGFDEYQLQEASPIAIGDVLERLACDRALADSVCLRGRPKAKDGALADKLILNQDAPGWLVYALFVRALRLCDGHALEQGGC